MSIKVDCKTPTIFAALVAAPLYRKNVIVGARQVSSSEQVLTILNSGKLETTNQANPGNYIVTNPDGERYVISEPKFLQKYESIGFEDQYQSKGFCKAITNPFGDNIEIDTSWGSPQYGDSRCMIATPCDSNGENLDQDPYLIDSVAFINTYISV
jgi:PGDYG protein